MSRRAYGWRLQVVELGQASEPERCANKDRKDKHTMKNRSLLPYRILPAGRMISLTATVAFLVALGASALAMPGPMSHAVAPTPDLVRRAEPWQRAPERVKAVPAVSPQLALRNSSLAKRNFELALKLLLSHSIPYPLY